LSFRESNGCESESQKKETDYFYTSAAAAIANSNEFRDGNRRTETMAKREQRIAAIDPILEETFILQRNTGK